MGKALSLAARRLYGYRVGAEEGENLALLRDRLRRHSAVVYFNHLFLGDGPLVITFLLDHLGGSIRVMGAVESRKHHDFRRDPVNASILRLAYPLGIRLFPVVQHYDRAAYSFAERTRRLRRLVRGAKEILSRPGGVILIAPEGTRSPDGALQRAQSGIEHLDRCGSSIYFFPVALIPKDKFERGVSFGSTFEVRTARPFLAKEVLPEVPEGLSLADGMMLRLAKLLPEEMRGIYAPYLR
ncbi:MAG TPA: hypothetical protein EYP55_07920 [Anaerolineae bacterium]|nr:hypothetical protein [Anaerolineae bacterium]